MTRRYTTTKNARSTGNRLAAQAIRTQTKTTRFLADPSAESAVRAVAAGVRLATRAVRGLSRPSRRSRRARAARSRPRGAQRAVVMDFDPLAGASQVGPTYSISDSMVAAPVAVGTITRGAAPTSVDEIVNGRRIRTITGEEIWIKVGNNTTGSNGIARLLTPALNPLESGLEYLGSQGAQFQKFNFLPGSCIKWRPTIPATTPGQVVMAFVTDPAINLSGITFDGLQRLPGAKVGSAWQPMDYVLSEMPDSEKYVTLGAGGTTVPTPADVRIGIQGLFVFALCDVPTTGSPSVPQGVDVGRLTMDYSVKLIDLNTEPIPLTTVQLGFTSVAATSITSASLPGFLTDLGALWKIYGQPAGRFATYIGPTRQFRVTGAVSNDADVSVSSFGPNFEDVDGNDLTPSSTTVFSGKNSGGSTNNNLAVYNLVYTFPKFTRMSLANSVASGNLSGFLAMQPV